jgi:hypothetical protein
VAFGDQTGAAEDAATPPAALNGLRMRAVRIRPEMALASRPALVNVVIERLPPSGPALPGGVLLTSDQLPVRPGGPMEEAGSLAVPNTSANSLRDTFHWYRRR